MDTAPTEPPPLQTVRIWDLPTRLFHWLLASAVIGCVVTAKIGGGAMVWHTRLGLCVLALVVFRLAWGFVGGHWSRFVRFVYAPGTLLRYLRGQARPEERLDVGHSPLGALSVFALLGVLMAQLGTGLVSDDEIAFVGPLNRFVATETGLAATSLHKTWGQWLVIGLVVLHVLAIVAYLVRRNDLLRPMIGGDKALPPGTPASADGAAQRGLALVLAVAAGALAWWVSRLGG
jgi:cytochrome b